LWDLLVVPANQNGLAGVRRVPKNPLGQKANSSERKGACTGSPSTLANGATVSWVRWPFPCLVVRVANTATGKPNLVIAGRLPANQGAELLGMAREAFSQAFELVTLVCAVLALAAAIAAGVLLKNVKPAA
jgi:hypothetical protein